VADRQPAKQGDCKVKRNKDGKVTDPGAPCWGPYRKIGSTFPMKQCKNCQRKS
jgi:hypothetical protein